MNKQELIEKIKANGEWFETNRYVKITKAVELISQLDEPQKVKVPEVVGKDLDILTKGRLKEDLVKDICFAAYDYSQGTPFDARTIEWCKKLSNLRTMIDAIWNGYEVEEEPKWIVRIGKIYLTGNQSYSFCKEDSTVFEIEKFAEEAAEKTGGKVEKV